jgi:hypothetical protein
MEELTCRIKSIDIDAEIYWFLGAYSVPDLLDDTVGTNLVNLAGLDNLETTIPIVLVVTWARERSADTRVDVSVVGEQTLLGSVVEICAVVDAGLLRGCTSENLWLPCIAAIF